jgi:C-terminal processing protease CtpA/Prc
MFGNREFLMAPLLCASLFVLGPLVPELPVLASGKNAAPSFDGYWQSDAYGLFVEIRGAELSTSQITSISCLPWWTAKRAPNDSTKGGAIFKRGDAAIHLEPGPSADTLLLREPASVTQMRLRRVRARPKHADDKLANTPPNNYALFWQTFAEQFALFELYHTDWQAVDRKYRPQVIAATTPEELFGILREMIRPFQNAHTNINAGSINRFYVGYRPVSEIGRKLQATPSLSVEQIEDLFSRQAQRTRDIIEAKYSEGKLRAYCNDKIHFGKLKDAIGYLRVLAFEGYAKDGSFEQEARSLEAALDDVFKDAKSMKGLIIDVRVNLGGADPFCLAIAARFAAAKYLAYSKVARNNRRGALRFTEPQPIWVSGSTRPGYHGRVVLLIGPDTISGGETFAMALMGRKPRVEFIGENTQGVFSDVVGRKLPNGWTFGVPNEKYLTETGKSFDSQGVPPNIHVPVFPKADLQSARDGALERAIAVLRSKDLREGEEKQQPRGMHLR